VLEHYDGDITRVNIQPRLREKVLARYGVSDERLREEPRAADERLREEPRAADERLREEPRAGA
jgi:alkane 1-monooxygenase